MTEINYDGLEQPDKDELAKARIDPYISEVLLGPVEDYSKALQATNDPEKIRSICSQLVRLGFIDGVIAAIGSPESLSEIFEAHSEDEGDQGGGSK